MRGRRGSTCGSCARASCSRSKCTTTAPVALTPRAGGCKGCAGASRRSTGRSQCLVHRVGRRLSARGCPVGAERLRVVIAEDLALLRDGLERLLRDNGFEVVAAVQDARALLDAVAREKPDVAVVDIRLPPDFRDEGLRAALQLRER